jgi:hypothetical protein
VILLAVFLSRPPVAVIASDAIFATDQAAARFVETHSAVSFLLRSGEGERFVALNADDGFVWHGASAL